MARPDRTARALGLAVAGTVAVFAAAALLAWLVTANGPGPESIPATPPAVAVPVEDPALTEWRYAIDEMEPDDGSWTFGRSELGVMHAGCWPEQYADLPREHLPVEVVEQLDDPLCILAPDVPRPGPSMADALDRRYRA